MSDIDSTWNTYDDARSLAGVQHQAQAAATGALVRGDFQAMAMMLAKTPSVADIVTPLAENVAMMPLFGALPRRAALGARVYFDIDALDGD